MEFENISKRGSQLTRAQTALSRHAGSGIVAKRKFRVIPKNNFGKARLSIETIKIELNSVVVAVADQVSCDLEGEAAVLNLKTGVYYGLDDIGASIWRMLNEPRRVDELVDALLGEYEVDREECQRDVIELVGELAVRGLVEINDGPQG
jgi:hypothetical protein